MVELNVAPMDPLKSSIGPVEANALSTMPLDPEDDLGGETFELADLVTSDGRLSLSSMLLLQLPELVCQLCTVCELTLTVLRRCTAEPGCRGQNNHLTTLPEDIRLMSQLRELYLSDNCLRRLPDSLGELAELRVPNGLRS